ncbi:mucin-21-like [Argopecten irradians]|uniref:mucin-21-like n=1 Tax=Argopecten irradians TaxID=31199 RepID=UPI0037135328
MEIFTLFGMMCLITMTAADHCVINKSLKNKMVDIDSVGDGVVVALLGSQIMMTSSDCVNSCCHTVDCNVAVFDSGNDSNTNCHMYKCEECKLKKQSNFTTYYISDEPKTTSHSTSDTTQKSSTLSSSSLSSTSTSASPEFETIVLNSPNDTITTQDGVPEMDNSVKGNIQESEIDIPLVIPDFESKLDDSEMIKPGSADKPTPTGPSNANTDISPIVPGSKTSAGPSEIPGTKPSDSNSNPSTQTASDSSSVQTNADTSSSSENTQSDKPSTAQGDSSIDSNTDNSSSDTAPPSSQTDSSSRNPSTVSNRDSSVTETDSSTDTVGTSGTGATDASQGNTDSKSDTTEPNNESSVPSGGVQVDSTQTNSATDAAAGSTAADTAPNSDTKQPTDSTQIDTPSGSQTDESTSKATSDTSGHPPKPSPESVSDDSGASVVTGNSDKPPSGSVAPDSSNTAQGGAVAPEAPDSSNTPPGGAVTSDNDAGNVKPPVSPTDKSPKVTSNPVTSPDQSPVADVPDGNPSTSVTESSTDLSDSQSLTGDSSSEETDTQQDLPENYNAPFVNHPTMVATALIAALSFGVIFFFAVTAIVGKRCYDGWQRRHYSRVDYLINGIYN